MLPALTDALADTLRMVPLLFLIYLVLEAVEGRYEEIIKSRLLEARRFGPLLGALAGCVPQCGFSVIATALYAERVVSRGTLVAVYLSTSDEAVPVRSRSRAAPAYRAAARPDHRRADRRVSDRSAAAVRGSADLKAPGGLGCLKPRIRAAACTPAGLMAALSAPALCATAAVTVFVFLIALLINLVVTDNIAGAFLPHPFWQPFAAVAVGIVPNCAASVAITEVFLHGGITFGSAIAGLCASAGLGILVLFKEVRKAEAVIVVAELAAISLAAGLIINYVG